MGRIPGINKNFKHYKKINFFIRLIYERMVAVFSGFNLNLDEMTMTEILGKRFNEYRKIGKSHLQREIDCFNTKLNDLIRLDSISGRKLEEYCFPNINADIFLSHSHKDRDLANALAGWIHENFKLNVFVDSNVWEYSGTLLEEINSRYSNKRHDGGNGYLYNHEACCKASEHVNTMLTLALHKMIDKVECVILLNTDNSVKVFAEKCFHATYSPWIYSEIMCTQIVRKKPLICYRDYNYELRHFYESTEIKHHSTNLVISYIVSLKHLVPIDFGDFITWLYNYRQNPGESCYPLDSLYSFTYKNHVEITKQLYRSMKPSQIDLIKKYFDGVLDDNFDLANTIQMILEGNENGTR